MKVTITQLATYIERDGWRRIQGGPPGYTRYGRTSQAWGPMHVDVPDAMIPALDAARDRAYRTERTRVLARAAR